MSRRQLVRAAAVALLAGCGLDTSGLGHASGTLGTATSPGGSSSGGEAPSETSTAMVDSSGSSGAPMPMTTTPSDGSTTATDDTDSADLTTGPPPDPCLDNPPITIVLEAATATLVPPMAFDTLLDGTDYVYSETANAGSASFEVDLPCTDDYVIWADVFDGEPGPLDTQIIDGDPADAIRIEIGGIATDWLYGCQSAGIELWSRQALSVNTLACIGNDLVVLPLVKGAQTLSITALEGGTHGGGITPGPVAAVSRVFITNVQDVRP